MLLEVTRERFASEVLDQVGPVLVDFWGPRCVPCLALLPAVEDIAERYAGKLKVVKVNAAENRRLCIDQKVFSLPTLLFYGGGKEIKRLAGEVSAEDLLEMVRELVNNSPAEHSEGGEQ
ncbi:MAG: thioredoxin family protein [Chloroflexi bacterium]|nr:thioredoxin family protein [Chloroflexota bacterium]MCL5075969.1 thioredoxin family protein [Chloroflexota bacterium]